MNTATVLKLVAFSVGGIAILAVLVEISGELADIFGSEPAAIWEVDRTEFERCRDLGVEAGGDDPDCATLWNDMRDRFLGRAPDTPTEGE